MPSAGTRRWSAAVVAAVLVVAILGAGTASSASRSTRGVAPGVTLTRLRLADGPVRAFVLRIDLDRDVTRSR